MSETRDEYVKMMKSKLDEWNAQISQLETMARQKEAQARLDYQQRVDALKEKRQALESRLEQVRQAGEGAWEDMKTGAELAAGALGEALRSAASRFQGE
jgi:predicted  nucleic acid-binding Zn-ribbon protein